jgi:hypothetical protein
MAKRNRGLQTFLAYLAHDGPCRIPKRESLVLLLNIQGRDCTRKFGLIPLPVSPCAACLLKQVCGFFGQIVLIVPVLSTQPTHKPFTINKMPMEDPLHTVELAGPNPADQPLNQSLTASFPSDLVASVATICGTLSGKSCMYS